MLDKLAWAKNDKSIITIEERVSREYWSALSEIFPDKFKFKGREQSTDTGSQGASDPINALFNLGYAILEGICLRAINGANLDPHIGFVHRMKVTRSPLLNDFQEPYRWLVDKTIIQAIEHGRL